MAHAFEKFQRWKTPDDVADLAHTQQPLFTEKHQTEYTGEGKAGVGQNTERDVQREDHSVCLGWRGRMLRGECGGEKKGQNDRDDEGTDRSLAVVYFETEVGYREEPAEERHRALQVMVWDGVHGLGSAQQRQVVED